MREVFVSLFDRGLIYRGKYIINWCPRCLTALSNEEAEKTDADGKLWHVRYPLEDGGFITIATTRPETILGDTGIAVHPDDPRYRPLIGKHAKCPLWSADPTGATTPWIRPRPGREGYLQAHSPPMRDRQRHGLPALKKTLTPDPG